MTQKDDCPEVTEDQSARSGSSQTQILTKAWCKCAPPVPAQLRRSCWPWWCSALPSSGLRLAGAGGWHRPAGGAHSLAGASHKFQPNEVSEQSHKTRNELLKPFMLSELLSVRAKTASALHAAMSELIKHHSATAEPDCRAELLL